MLSSLDRTLPRRRRAVSGACLVFLVLLTLAAGATSARADGPASGANVIQPLLTPPPNANSIIANPAGGSTADLDTAVHTVAASTAAPARPLGPFTVQGPAGGAQSPSYRNPSGPLNIAGALDFATCHGGPTHVSAVVYDESGYGVANATVSGYVQFADSGSSLNRFPVTADDGFTDMMFNIGDPRGYEVVISLHAEQGGDAADTTIQCYAPY